MSKFKKTMRKSLDGFGKYRLFFLRGYQLFFALVISMISQSLIIYTFLIKNVSAFSWIERFIFFFILFVCILIPSAIIIGKFDFEKGGFKQENREWAKNSPVWNELFERLKRIEKKIDNENDEYISNNLLNKLKEEIEKKIDGEKDVT